MLPQHDHEIIVVSPDPMELDFYSTVKHFIDEKKTGSVAAINQAYKQSNGEVIVIIVDDHLLPPNFLELDKYFQEPLFKAKKIKIGNAASVLGGPGFTTFTKRDKSLGTHWLLEHQFRGEQHPNFKPYNVVFFPILFRESIETYMDGVVFNESFIHHLPDHWLGYYSDMINGECALGPTHISFMVHEEFNQLTQDKQHDEYDAQVLFKLIRKSSEGIPYNFRVDGTPTHS